MPGVSLSDLIGRPEWHARAACRDVHPNFMFPLEKDVDGMKAAKALCARCPVRSPCLAAALLRQEPDGIWGGFGVDERKRILRNLPDRNS